jgi:hypothetical protein
MLKTREKRRKSDRSKPNDADIIQGDPIGNRGQFPSSRAEKYLRKKEDFP